MDYVNLSINKNTYSNNSISIDNFTAKVDEKILFDNSSLKLSSGIYSLIGKNGCGKSTLLLLLKNKLLPVNPNWDILYLEQEMKYSNENPIDFILNSNYRLKFLNDRVKDIEIIMENGDIDDNLMEEYNNIMEELNIYNNTNQEHQVKKILYGLGFDDNMLKKPCDQFSGGWKMRISLARALYIKPDLLLMDEPTNHLDLEAIIWLTDYLMEYSEKKIVLIVSHNIGFLNNVSNYILNIENNKINSYKGNYNNFKKQNIIKKKEIQKKYDNFMKKVKKMKKKGIKNKDIETMMKKENVIKPTLEKKSKIDFFNYNLMINNIVNIDNLTFGYKDNLFENVNFGIDSDDKIILVGPNGSGKSTLLKLIDQEIPNEFVKVKNGIKISVYNQHFENTLPLDKTPVEYLSSIVPSDIKGDPKFIVRQYLGKLRLEASAHNKIIKELSGGMKARVALTKMIFERPHLMILDEPTNHLDIMTVEDLIEGLKDFKGAFIVITHESELIETMEDEIKLYVVKNKKVIHYPEDFNSYCNKIINSV